MHTIKITHNLLLEYQRTSDKFIRLLNRIEKIDSVAKIESKLFLPELECSITKHSIHRYTHTHPFNGPFPGLPGWAGTRKVKPIWISLKQETMRGSGISWAICKSASRSRQITIPAPHHSSFFTGRMPFLPPNQQRQSTEGIIHRYTNYTFWTYNQYCVMWIWNSTILKERMEMLKVQ